MREIRIDAPRIVGDRLEVTWHVEPATALYKRTSFSMRLPGPIPDRVAWTIALLCLHAHWSLLRPCRVQLPVRLAPGENEFWCRLADAQIVTLEAHRGGRETARAIEIVECGAPIDDVPPLEARGLCAASFSGGKDSLLQAGLLAELRPEVLLVTTTSPMPPLRDHETARRRHVLREIVARRANVELIEIESDFRASWKNDFPPSVGYQVAVNELTDTFLYLASLIAASWTRGATHLFLASEGEVQENIEAQCGAGNPAGPSDRRQDCLRHTEIIQHPHLMYSVVTQSAVSAVLARIGMQHGSLISPLRSHQVQQLLWKRYGDLADLQYSCWRVGEDDATCSSCSQCLRIAFAALAAGEDPRRMGIDLVKLMSAMKRWMPRLADAHLPGDRVAAELHAQTARSIAATPLPRFADAIGRSHLLSIERFRRLRARMPAVGPQPGYRPAYLAHVDSLVRDEIAAIYAESFAPDDTEAMRRRGEALTRWITEPLEVSEESAVAS